MELIIKKIKKSGSHAVVKELKKYPIEKLPSFNDMKFELEEDEICEEVALELRRKYKIPAFCR